MKRIATIGIVVCMCVSLCACSQPSTQSSEPSSSSSKESSVSKDELKSYLAEADEIVTGANAAMNDALASLKDGNSQGCVAANDKMNELNSNLESMNVPQTCEENYGQLKVYTLNAMAATAAYTSASFKTDLSERTKMMDEGNAAVNDATQALNEYNASLREIPLPE